MSTWSELPELKARLEKLWQRGDLLTGTQQEGSRFPLRLPLKGPRPGELGHRFEEVRAWVQHWAALEMEHGLPLEWREVNSREIGRNRLPVALLLEQREQALALIGKQQSARRFDALHLEILGRYPALGGWVARHPLQTLALCDQWPRLLSVLDWLTTHPRPGLYLRQLELPGVHTKFIEGHKKLLMTLLDTVLDPAAIDASARGASSFEARYGFRARPVQVRFRLLDPALALHGLRDLQIPVEDFSRLALAVDTVFITENLINGLAFPDHPRALVLFGLGYGLDSLRSTPWLADKRIWYWGDLDTHGFAMLDQLRSYFPQTRSLLMDRATLLAHEPLWGEEPKPVRKPLPRLNDAEQALYDDLCHDRLAPALRLEQERIGFDRLQATLLTISTQ